MNVAKKSDINVGTNGVEISIPARTAERKPNQHVRPRRAVRREADFDPQHWEHGRCKQEHDQAGAKQDAID
eukprot:1232225-Prymnesium_polylepis.1